MYSGKSKNDEANIQVDVMYTLVYYIFCSSSSSRLAACTYKRRARKFKSGSMGSNDW
jgi:hypothetical protein